MPAYHTKSEKIHTAVMDRLTMRHGIQSRYHDIEHNDFEHNDIQHNDPQHNDTRHSGLNCDTHH
jgi:hypothetical protein